MQNKVFKDYNFKKYWGASKHTPTKWTVCKRKLRFLSHTHILSSRLTLTTYSGEQLRVTTGPECQRKACMHVPVSKSHIRTEPSCDPLTAARGAT